MKEVCGVCAVIRHQGAHRQWQPNGHHGSSRWEPQWGGIPYHRQRKIDKQKDQEFQKLKDGVDQLTKSIMTRKEERKVRRNGNVTIGIDSDAGLSL